MIRECLELTCMGRDDILLDTRLSVQSPVLVSMDILQQVIVNLVGNAVQAMAENGGTLTVTSQQDGATLVIKVEDSGPGIAPEHMDKIFEPFFTTKEVGEGTGLGLAVSYSLVERMGGALTAGNRPEGGAVFTVAIPLKQEPATHGETS
jgi:signal transduction histidine kinase